MSFISYSAVGLYSSAYLRSSSAVYLRAGTEYLEPTDFAKPWNLVSGSIRDRRVAMETAEQQRKDDVVKVKLDALKVKQKRPSVTMDALQVGRKEFPKPKIIMFSCKA